MIHYHAGDSLIRLKNAALAGHKDVLVTNTKLVVSIMEALKRMGVVRELEKVDERQVKVFLSYKRKEPVLMDVNIISRPGLHIYMDATQLGARKKSTALILTTSKGIMSHKEAVKLGIGGEVIAEIH